MDKSTILRKRLLPKYSELFEEELIQEIVEVGFLRKLDHGNFLIDIGDELTHIPLIIDGVVKIIRKDKEGYELSLYYLEPGNT
ncbi:MAG: Crp/Fnr family transcriptional regulator, partial [Salegentibacter sp.]